MMGLPDCFAQSIERQVFSTSGFHTEQIDFTIGEVITSTFQNNDYLLTQGFEQGKLIDIDVNEISSISSLLIYPNPTRFHFAVATPGQSSSLDISIHDMTGKLVDIISVYQQIQNVDITALAAGTYVLNIISKDQKINERHLLVKL
jgi:hypothetical protein